MGTGEGASATGQPLDRLADRLTDRGATLAVAESCTGGLLAAELTARPGASAYFLGGVVAYANELKVRALGVEAELIQRAGGVSRETAEAMAQGARMAFDATFAVSITGIAGPGGGTPEKPVGLVYTSVAGARGVRTRRAVHRGDREEIRRAGVEGAVDLLLEVVEERPGPASG